MKAKANAISLDDSLSNSYNQVEKATFVRLAPNTTQSVDRLESYLAGEVAPYVPEWRNGSATDL